MKRLGIALTLLLATGASAHGRNFTIDGDNCSSRNIRFDDEPAVVEKQVIQAGNLRSLKAAVDHAPLSVRGGNSSGYTITVCKAAAVASDLAAIRVSVEGGELKTVGPKTGDWTVHYLIEVPRGADLDLEASNGPISVRDVDGRVVAKASNGPIALHNLSGDVDVTTTNGPISIHGGSGDMKVRASNGPLSVDLDGNAWTGGTLDATTKNGPLSLKLPRNYASGVTVESNGRGPISCRAAGCERARRNAHEDRWDDEPRTIELGSGATAVRLSTVNGPITIKDE
jgi:Putative adhesin